MTVRHQTRVLPRGQETVPAPKEQTGLKQDPAKPTGVVLIQRFVQVRIEIIPGPSVGNRTITWLLNPAETRLDTGNMNTNHLL